MSKVSVIIPSYNHEKFLKDRLDSIINQTFQDFEIIIIDDCSTDNSYEILNDFVTRHPEKIRHFIRNTENSGSGYKSWRKGIELAETKYVWIAETDDFSSIHFLEEMISVLESSSDISLVFCASNVIDEKNNVLSNSDRRTSKLNVPEGDAQNFNLSVFLDNMPFKTFITNGSSVVFKKPINFPNFLFDYKQMSDAFLWTFLITNQDFSFLNKKLNYFRRHSSATTVTMHQNNLKQVFAEKIAYLNYFKLNHKYNIFIKEYIRLYVWNNKKLMFNFELINSFENITFKRTKYFWAIIVFTSKKIKDLICK